MSVAKPEDGIFQKLDKVLHQKNVFTDLLEKLESKSGVRRLHLAIGLSVFIAVYLMFGYGASVLCNFIGFAYPAYKSFKAIESVDKDDDTAWLIYWVVYSTFHFVEIFGDIFLFWIPFYWFCKCGFLVYCMAPTSWNGSVKIYYSLIRPFILQHQEKIDKALNNAGSMATEAISGSQKALPDNLINDIASSAVKSMSDELLIKQNLLEDNLKVE